MQSPCNLGAKWKGRALPEPAETPEQPPPQPAATDATPTSAGNALAVHTHEEGQDAAALAAEEDARTGEEAE